jgi:hypothetical protein
VIRQSKNRKFTLTKKDKNMQLKYQRLYSTYQFDVEVGDIKATLDMSLVVWKDDSDEEVQFETEFTDITNITYRGMEIEGYGKWTKFKEFHMEMGIDYETLIQAEYDKVVTEDVVKQLVKVTSKKL